MDAPEGYEIYEPVAGKVYSPGTMCRLKYDEDDEWMEQKCNRVHCDPEWADVDEKFIYMRPSSSSGRRVPPNDTCLTWLSNKIDEAAKKHPDKAESLRLDWFAAKSKLAEEMLAKIGGMS